MCSSVEPQVVWLSAVWCHAHDIVGLRLIGLHANVGEGRGEALGPIVAADREIGAGFGLSDRFGVCGRRDLAIRSDMPRTFAVEAASAKFSIQGVHASGAKRVQI